MGLEQGPEIVFLCIKCTCFSVQISIINFGLSDAFSIPFLVLLWDLIVEIAR